MKTIKTLKQLAKICGKHQINAQEVLNERICSEKEGWITVKIDPDLRVSVCNDLSELYGGHHRTRINVFNTLLYARPQHWGLSRTLLNSDLTWSYCAGQDYVWECAEIRKCLK